MPRNRAKAVTQSQWEKAKEPLYQSWMVDKKPMKSRDGGREGIIDIMEDRRQFFATENQHGVQFTSRNQQSEHWRAVAYLIDSYMRETREWEAFKDGILYDRNKVITKIAPWKPRSPIQAYMINNLTPIYGTVRSVLQRQKNERHACTMIVHRNSFSVRDSHFDMTTHGPLFSDGHTIESLNAIVPESLVESHLFNGALHRPDAPAFVSPLYRKVLYSVANDFTGLGAIPMAEILQYLQAETDQKLYYPLSSIQGHSARALVQNYFKGAVESGDHRIVNTLLDERSEDVDLDEEFLDVDHRHWTPIERVANLGHIGLLKVLLKHRADVNRTYPSDSGPPGALESAIKVHEGRGRYRIDPDLELCNLVLDAGGHLSGSTIRAVLERSKSFDIAYAVMFKNAKNNVAKCNEEGVFRAAIIFLDKQRSTEVINLMRELNADLNYRVRGSGGPSSYPPRIIDVASKRVSLQLISLLRSLEVVLTDDTLSCAVASGNEELVRTLLFEMDVDACSIGTIGITPLAAAIRLQNSGLFTLLEQYGAVHALQIPLHAHSALKAASEVGDVRFIESLIHLGTKNISAGQVPNRKAPS